MHRLRSRMILAFVAAVLATAACGNASHAWARSPAAHPGAPAAWQLEWARGATFYEIFVRSFADSDGDGIGDLRGIIEHLDYLRGAKHSLAVDALWISPFYPSPMADFGYDIRDYCDVDPLTHEGCRVSARGWLATPGDARCRPGGRRGGSFVARRHRR